MRPATPRRTTSRSSFVAIVAVALALPACGKKKDEDTAASPSKGSTPVSTSTTKAPPKAPPKPPGPVPTEPAPTADPAPAPAPPADSMRLEVAYADPAKGTVQLEFGKWSVASSSFVYGFDPTNLEGAKVVLEIDAASLTSSNEVLAATFKSMDYLDVAKFPTVTVVVDNVKKSVGTDYTADARVTAHGIEKVLVINVDVVATAADRVTVKATPKISRVGFQVGGSSPPSSYADEVGVDAVVTLKKP